jgi:hypothetical protein
MCRDPPADLPPTVEVVPDEDLAGVLAEAICDGKGGRMTRTAEVFLATACAEFLVDRLALAGFVVVRGTGA